MDYSASQVGLDTCLSQAVGTADGREITDFEAVKGTEEAGQVGLGRRGCFPGVRHDR